MGVRTMARLLNTTTTTYTANQTITFTNNTFSTPAIEYDSTTGILIKTPGTYLVIANFTAVATVENTDASITMAEDGTAAAGATDTITLAAVGDYGHLSIADLVTVKGDCSSDYATLTFENNAAVSISNASVVIMRVI